MNRLEQAIEKYGEVARHKGHIYQTSDLKYHSQTEKIILKKGVSIKTINDIASWDPSGNNKYLDWILKTKIETKLTYRKLKDFILLFHDKPSKFSKKDIYQYKTEDEILQELDSVSNKLTKSEIKELGAEVIIDTLNYKIIRPTTAEAVRLYGAGTKWCITSAQTFYFKRYLKNNDIYFVLIKDTKIIRSWPKTQYYKLAILFGKPPHTAYRKELMIYDAKDEELWFDDLYEIYNVNTNFVYICQEDFKQRHKSRNSKVYC